MAQQAVAKVSAAYKLDGREMRISACAGVSFHGDVDFDDALRRADIALMMRSVRCAEAFPFFSVQIEQDVRRRTAIEQTLREPGLGSEIQLASNRYSIFSRFSSARSRHSRAGGPN